MSGWNGERNFWVSARRTSAPAASPRRRPAPSGGRRRCRFLRRREAREAAHDLKLTPWLDAAGPVELDRVLRLDPRGAPRQSALLLHGQLDEVGGGDRRGGDGGGRRPGEECSRNASIDAAWHGSGGGNAPPRGSVVCPAASRLPACHPCSLRNSHRSPTRTHPSPSRGSGIPRSGLLGKGRAPGGRIHPGKKHPRRAPVDGSPQGAGARFDRLGGRAACASEGASTLCRRSSSRSAGPPPQSAARECYTREPSADGGVSVVSTQARGCRLTHVDGWTHSWHMGLSPCAPRRPSSSSSRAAWSARSARGWPRPHRRPPGEPRARGHAHQARPVHQRRSRAR